MLVIGQTGKSLNTSVLIANGLTRSRKTPPIQSKLRNQAETESLNSNKDQNPAVDGTQMDFRDQIEYLVDETGRKMRQRAGYVLNPSKTMNINEQYML